MTARPPLTFRVRVAPATWIDVPSLCEASRAVRRHIDQHLLASSTWGQASAPVEDESGEIVAYVSYNGRVWTPERNWERRREITGSGLRGEGDAA